MPSHSTWFDQENSERACLFDLLTYTNECTTLDELTRFCLERLSGLVPFRSAFFLLGEGTPPRPVLVQPRNVPPTLEHELRAPDSQNEFLTESHAALSERVRHLLSAHDLGVGALVPLTARTRFLGLLVLAAELFAESPPFSDEFACTIGAHIGLALDRLRTGERAAEQQPATRGFLNQIQDGYWQTDQQGRIVLVNDAALAALKRPRAEVLNQRFDELSNADPEAMRELRAQLARDGIARDFLLRVRASDGEIRTIRQTLRLLKDAQGDIIGHQGIFRDLTESLRTLQELEQRNRELQLLHELATRLNAESDQDAALRAGVELIVKLLHAEAIGILLVNTAEARYDLVVHHGVEPELVRNYATGRINPAIYEPGFDPGESVDLIEYLILTQRVLNIQDLRALPRMGLEPIFAFGYQSLLAFPISFGTHVYGAVMVGSKEVDAFDEHTVQVVNSVSAQLGLKLRNQQLLNNVRQQFDETKSTIETGTLLQFALGADEQLPKVVQKIQNTFNASYVVLHRLREDHFEHVTASDSRESQRRFPIAEYERRMLDSATPLIVQDRDAPEVDPEQRARLAELDMRAVMGIRLFAQKVPLGLLFVNHATRRKWRAGEVQMLQAFAQQIANALESKRLFDKVDRQVHELGALAQVSRVLASSQPRERALTVVANVVAQVFNADYVGFHLREEKQLRLVAQTHDVGAGDVMPIQPYQHRILEELDPISVNDAREWADARQQAFLLEYNILADLGVPLVSEQKAIGIMYISLHQPHVWSKAEVELAETFARQIASSLARLQLLKELKLQVEEWRTLTRNTTLLAHTRSPNVTLPQIAHELRHLLQVDYVGFHLKEGDQLRIITEAVHPFNGECYPILAHHWAVLDYRQPLITNDLTRDAKGESHRATLERFGYQAAILMPMIARGNVLGILVASQKTPRVWKEREQRLTLMYAQHIANLLDNVQLLNAKQDRLEELSQLAELADLTSEILDEQDLERTALSALENMLKADRVLLYMIRDGVRQPARASDGSLLPLPSLPQSPIFHELFQSRRPFIIDPLHQPVVSKDVKERMEQNGAESVLVMPVFSAVENFGAVSFVFRSEHIFTEPEIHIAQSAANQLAMAFTNARFIREREARIQRLTNLSEFSLWCGAQRNITDLQEESVKRILELLDVQAASVRLVQGNMLTIGASAGYPDPAERNHPIEINPSLQDVLELHQPYSVDDLAAAEDISQHWRERHLRQGFQSSLLLPMMAEPKVIGILTLFRDRVHHWTEIETRYAQNVANALALAVSNVQQIATAQAKSDELQATFDSVFSGVFSTNADGAINSWNRAAERITGFKESDMLGKKWHEEGPSVGVHRRADLLVLESIAENKVQFSIAPRFFRRADGATIHLREAVAPLPGPHGAVRGAVCAFWDWTAEQAAERAKVDYINLVGHQLGNKLSAMLWGAEQLGNGGLNKSSRAELVAIMQDTRRELEAFTQRFNAFQREHIQEQIECKPVNLRELVRKKIITWRMTHPDRRFRMSGTFDQVLADEMRLDVVIENLLDNACKYSPKNSWITIRSRLHPSSKLELQIQNRGKPIPPDILPQIFERWQRADSEQPGSGLGLWLVRTKLDEIGGEIHVESDSRHGTTFHIMLARPGFPALPTNITDTIAPKGETQ